MLNFWFKLSDKFRFAIIGCVNAAFCYLLYATFINFLGKGYYQPALALAWTISSITSFITHKYLVFRTRGKLLKEYLKCCSTWLISYFLNALILEFLVSIIKINVYMSQIIAPAIAGIFTYFMFKKIAFKNL